MAAVSALFFIRRRRVAGAGLPTTAGGGGAAGGSAFAPALASAAAGTPDGRDGAGKHASELDSFVVQCPPTAASQGISTESLGSMPPMGSLGSASYPSTQLDSFVSQPSAAGLDSFPAGAGHGRPFP